MIIDELGGRRRPHQPIDLLRPQRDAQAAIAIATEQPIGPPLPDRPLQQPPRPQQVIVVPIHLAGQERERAGAGILHDAGSVAEAGGRPRAALDGICWRR